MSYDKEEFFYGFHTDLICEGLNALKRRTICPLDLLKNIIENVATVYEIKEATAAPLIPNFGIK